MSFNGHDMRPGSSTYSVLESNITAQDITNIHEQGRDICANQAVIILVLI